MIDHPAFRCRPDKGQFARLGRWECAWSFDSQQLPSDADVIRYVRGATEIAFEAFFADSFIGLRCNERSEVEPFSRNCLRALSEAVNGPGFFSLLSRFNVCRRIGTRFEFAEVGAVNCWQSSKPYRIEHVPRAPGEVKALFLALNSSGLARNVTHPKAIEFVFAGKPIHWFGFPISEPQPPYEIVLRKLQATLGAVQPCLDLATKPQEAYEKRPAAR
jgi:hypothetical protein